MWLGTKEWRCLSESCWEVLESLAPQFERFVSFGQLFHVEIQRSTVLVYLPVAEPAKHCLCQRHAAVTVLKAVPVPLECIWIPRLNNVYRGG